MARNDFLVDGNGKLQTEGGDFVTGASDDQHVEMLLEFNKGELKENPTIGVGLNQYLKKQNTSLTELKRAIKVGLEADKYKVNDLVIEADGAFNLDYELDE